MYYQIARPDENSDDGYTTVAMLDDVYDAKHLLEKFLREDQNGGYKLFYPREIEDGE